MHGVNLWCELVVCVVLTCVVHGLNLQGYVLSLKDCMTSMRSDYLIGLAQDKVIQLKCKIGLQTATDVMSQTDANWTTASYIFA